MTTPVNVMEPASVGVITATINAVAPARYGVDVGLLSPAPARAAFGTSREMGIDYATGAWRGFAAPKGLPADMVAELTAALKKVYDSKEYNDFMSSRGFGVKWADGAGFAQFMDAGDAIRDLATLIPKKDPGSPLRGGHLRDLRLAWSAPSP